MIDRVRMEKNGEPPRERAERVNRNVQEKTGWFFRVSRGKQSPAGGKIIKRTALIIAFVFLLSQNSLAAPAQPPRTDARSVILYEMSSDTVLYSENADEKLSIASITKIMTALIVLENCDLEDEVEIKREWTLIEGSSSNIAEGRRYTVRQLLYGLLLASGNDAACALACHTAGGISEFAELMNEKAKELGMSNSSFKNPHGLDEHGHYSTAADMALLTAAAMKNKDFALIVATKEAKIDGVTFVNHNKMLWNYPDTVGVKTGYTSLAGRTLVTCANKNDMTLICVTLNDSNDWSDHTELYDWAGTNYMMKTAVHAGEPIARLEVISGMMKSVGICAKKDICLLLNKDDNLKVDIMLPKFVYAGVTKGSKAGTAVVLINGKRFCSVDLVYSDTVPLDLSIPLSFWEQIKRSVFPSSEFSQRIRQIIS